MAVAQTLYSTEVHADHGMADEQFVRWAELLERRTGVVVPLARKTFLVGAVRSRMRETGCNDYEDYFQRICSSAAGAVEWGVLVDRLTVHETKFFRHLPSFELIEKQWLPQQLGKGSDHLHAWSVGCSSGEEAWSLAMVMHRFFSERLGKVNFGISASDVSQAALATARAAVYPVERLSEIPLTYRADYVEMVSDTTFRPVKSLHRRVGFVRVNLLQASSAPLQRLNLIFCQNVLIYFSRERRLRLLDGLASLLEPGGLLIIGSGDIGLWNHSALQRVAWPGTLAYLKN